MNVFIFNDKKAVQIKSDGPLFLDLIDSEIVVDRNSSKPASFQLLVDNLKHELKTCDDI